MADGVVSCGWALAEPIGGCPPLPDDAEGRELYAQALAAAGEYLDRWTAHRFGVCPVTVHPCRMDQPPRGTYSQGGAPWYPVLIDGQWLNVTCGSPACSGGCLSTCRHDTIRLPGPIASVESVTIEGEVLDPGAYRLADSVMLYRVDGGSWPVAQDFTDDGFVIAYSRGRPIPVGGLVALGALSCELYKALTGDKSCSLPKRVQTITREGVSMTLLDGFDSLDRGYSGLWEVDSWIASVNSAPRRGATVASPDYNYRGAAAQGVRLRRG